MRWTAFSLIVSGSLLLAGCGGDGGSPAPVAGGAPAPPSGPGDSPPTDGGGAPAEGTPPPSEEPQQQPGDGYNPMPGDAGGPGGYGGGIDTPGYNADGTEAAPPRPRVKSLRERAIDAFRAGNEHEGFRLLRTHLAISPSAQADVSEKVAWVPGLRRPAVGSRIAIAALYVTPVGDFAESPQPIGSPELTQALASLTQRAGRGGKAGVAEASAPSGGYGGENGAGVDPAKAAEEQLAFYTGEFGTKLLTVLKTKVEGGEYGAIFKDLVEEVARPPMELDPNNPTDPNAAAGVNPGDGGYVDPATGVPGMESASGPKRLAMAITWLGKTDKEKDKKDETAKLAEESGADLLITYEIALKATRVEGLYSNQTTMKITDTKRGEVLYTSPVLDNRVVMQEREKGQKPDDPVDKAVGRAIEALDKFCKPAPLPPQVTAERAKARIAGLIAEKPADPLPVLLETRFYTAKGLLTESEMQSAAISLLGEAEYAQLIASSPEGAMTQAVGSAISLPGMIELMRGVNAATGASARAKARRDRDATNPEAPRARGWRDFLPVGGGKK